MLIQVYLLIQNHPKADSNINLIVKSLKLIFIKYVMKYHAKYLD